MPQRIGLYVLHMGLGKLVLDRRRVQTSGTQIFTVMASALDEKRGGISFDPKGSLYVANDARN